MSEAASSQVMPGGADAVATVSSNRSVAPIRSARDCVTSSCLIGSVTVEQASAGLSSKRGVSFASRLCQAVSSAAPSQPALLALYIKCLSREGLRR